MIEISVWTHIIIEGYCGFDLHRDKLQHTKSQRPKWCQRKYKGSKERVPQERCLHTGKDDKMCKFFAFAECQDEVMMLFNQVYDVFADECHDKDFEPDKKKVVKLMTHIKSFEGLCNADKYKDRE